MLPIFTFLQEELNQLGAQDLLVPTEPIDEHEEVVGEITDLTLQKLCTVTTFMERDAKIALLHASTTSGDARHVYRSRASELSEKARIGMQAFWVSVKDAHGLWGEESLGLRAGWKIVKIDLDRKRRELEELLAKLESLDPSQTR